jgi:hypothetical protein
VRPGGARFGQAVRVIGSRDWLAWHGGYDDPDSSLSRRLRVVQREIFVLPFTNVATFAGQLMVGETGYFDLATLCEQASLPLDAVRRAAKERANRPR